MRAIITQQLSPKMVSSSQAKPTYKKLLFTAFSANVGLQRKLQP